MMLSLLFLAAIFMLIDFSVTLYFRDWPIAERPLPAAVLLLGLSSGFSIAFATGLTLEEDLTELFALT